MDAIVTQGLTKHYSPWNRRKGPSLADLNLTVAEGQIFGFLGRNGAGKTTTIKILCSLLKPSAGEAWVFGESVKSRAAKRLVGYLPEQPYFYEYLTPVETLDFYGQIQGLSRAHRQKEWDALSEMLDLRGIANQRIKEFSKGMRQRIGFAVALVGDPPLLILDEPMSGLDPMGRRMIRELILLQRERKKTVFFSSHVLGDVEQICDQVGMLVNGKLVRQGCIEELTRGVQPEIEVAAARLNPQTVKQLAGHATAHRHADGLDIFTFPSEAEANEAARAMLESGGSLVSFTPLKQTLEDYFMREQEQHEEATR